MTKDTLITWKNPRILGALCQDPGTKTKYVSHYLMHRIYMYIAWRMSVIFFSNICLVIIQK